MQPVVSILSDGRFRVCLDGREAIGATLAEALEQLNPARDYQAAKPDDIDCPQDARAKPPLTEQNSRETWEAFPPGMRGVTEG